MGANTSVPDGYTRVDWPGITASDAPGLLNSYVRTWNSNTFNFDCAASCNSTASCVFFSTYVWYDPVVNKDIETCRIYDRIVPVTSATVTSVNNRIVFLTAGFTRLFDKPTTPSDYAQQWADQSAAADGPGYISSYAESSESSSYTDFMSRCATSCTQALGCTFFNTYQELQSTPSDNVCVLWQYNKPLSSATNTYNNGRPISNSAGFLLSSLVTSTTTTTSSASPSSTSAAVPGSTPVAALGYTLDWTNSNSAADGQGYLTSFESSADSITSLVADCASSCTANSACHFFNVYQELESSPPGNICVLWNTAKPSSSATNSYNNGKPISNSFGYLRVIESEATTTITSSSTSTSTDTASSTPTTAGEPPVEVAGFSTTWTALTAAADGPGYISSYASMTASDYPTLVEECAVSCSAETSCRFFNAYQDTNGRGSSLANVCVLWNQNKLQSSATNVYNNGRPIMRSSGYLKAESSTESSTLSSTTTTSSTTISDASSTDAASVSSTTTSTSTSATITESSSTETTSTVQSTSTDTTTTTEETTSSTSAEATTSTTSADATTTTSAEATSTTTAEETSSTSAEATSTTSAEETSTTSAEATSTTSAETTSSPTMTTFSTTATTSTTSSEMSSETSSTTAETNVVSGGGRVSRLSEDLSGGSTP